VRRDSGGAKKWGPGGERDWGPGGEPDALRERRVAIVENIRDNEQAGLRYRADIEVNESSRRAIQVGTATCCSPRHSMPSDPRH